MSDEVWRPIGGFEGRYEVSSLGRVRSLRERASRRDRERQEPLVMKLGTKPNGYRYVVLGSGKSRRTATIHRLVLETFIGPAGEREASHLDGDRGNNRLSNLAWETRDENHRRKIGHGTSHAGEGNQNAALTESDVREIRRRGAAGESPAQIAPDFPVTRSGVREVPAAVDGAKECECGGCPTCHGVLTDDVPGMPPWCERCDADLFNEPEPKPRPRGPQQARCGVCDGVRTVHNPFATDAKSPCPACAAKPERGATVVGTDPNGEPYTQADVDALAGELIRDLGHDRPDGTRCNYLADGVCNKCGAVGLPRGARDGTHGSGGGE